MTRNRRNGKKHSILSEETAATLRVAAEFLRVLLILAQLIILAGVTS